jgi:hypothetical protein
VEAAGICSVSITLLKARMPLISHSTTHPAPFLTCTPPVDMALPTTPPTPSNRFVQPLRFCQDPTLASNPTWSSLRLPMVSAPAPSPAAPNLTAMWSTSPLRLTLARPAATLAEAIAKGLLNSTCGSGAGCAATARWELGKWGACTKRCDSGTRTRTADCIQTSSGELVAGWIAICVDGIWLHVSSSAGALDLEPECHHVATAAASHSEMLPDAALRCAVLLQVLCCRLSSAAGPMGRSCRCCRAAATHSPATQLCGR